MAAAKRRLSIRDVLTDRRIALMLPLGFSSGLPFLLVFSTLSAWLREAGISRTEIGVLSWVALAYSFKFLWAPIVDRYDVRCSRASARTAARLDGPVAARHRARPRGRRLERRADAPVAHHRVCPSRCLRSATQDVVIDGWRIDAATTDARA